MSKLVLLAVIVVSQSASLAESSGLQSFCAREMARFSQGCVQFPARGPDGVRVCQQQTAPARYESCLATGCFQFARAATCYKGRH